MEGRLIDGTTGEGIAGAIVVVDDRWAVTDEAGNYRVSGIEPGTQTITITPPDGYILPGEIEEITVGEGSTELGGIVAAPDVELPPGPPAPPAE